MQCRTVQDGCFRLYGLFCTLCALFGDYTCSHQRVALQRRVNSCDCVAEKRTAEMKVLLKRAYEDAGNADGFRVLVDRLWPRGKKKADLRLNAWVKEVAPSTELRKWFNHDPKRWLEFCKRYKEELRSPEAKKAIADTVHIAQ